jgi:hypothetical protein
MFNSKKFLAGVSGLILAFLITGCNLLGNNTKEETPTRPSPARQAPMNPSPTKKTPGASAITVKDLTNRINRIQSAVRAKEWAKANTETNALAADMARFKPTDKNTVGKKVGTLPDMAQMDAAYARLQVNIKAKNSEGALADLKEMKKLLAGNKGTNGTTTNNMKANK